MDSDEERNNLHDLMQKEMEPYCRMIERGEPLMSDEDYAAGLLQTRQPLPKS